jgi:O-antigen ligase
LEFYSSGDELKISPVKILSYTTSGVASVLSFIIILQFLGLVPFAGTHLGILSQPFTSSGILLCALFITLSLLPSDFSFCRSSRMLSRFGFWVLGISAFQIIAILFLGQLSSWFGLILGLLVFISSTRLFSKKQIFAMALASVCLLTLAYNVSPRIKTKIDRLSSFEHLLENKSIQCRFEIWKINYLLWLEKPILGLKKIMPYNCVLSSKRPATRMTHAHNIYFQNLFQGGLVRFIAWIIFFLTLLFNLLKFRSTWSIPFLSGFLALSLEGFFENWWGDSEVLTLFFLMMLIFNNRAKSACLKS